VKAEHEPGGSPVAGASQGAAPRQAAAPPADDSGSPGSSPAAALDDLRASMRPLTFKPSHAGADPAAATVPKAASPPRAARSSMASPAPAKITATVLPTEVTASSDDRSDAAAASTGTRSKRRPHPTEAGIAGSSVSPSAAVPTGAAAPGNARIVQLETSGTDGAAVRIAEDLVRLLDDGTTRRVLPVMSKGSLQNLSDLHNLRNIDLAIVHTDLLDSVRAQNADLTYVTKLYTEEFHLLAGADVKSVDGLTGKKVAVGGRDSAMAFTAVRVFELLGVRIEPIFEDAPLGLEKLRRGEVAAVAYVAAKPSPFIADVRPGDHLHLVPVPQRHDLLAAYAPAGLTNSDYPSLVADTPVDTVSVGTVMLAANLPTNTERYRNVANMVEAFFTQFPTLSEPGHHAKWREVSLAAELPGWHRFAAADAWLKRNQNTPAVAMGESQLREIFSRFLEERTKSTGGAMTQRQRDDLFNEFRRWQISQAQ
jgi:TRAP-type uncharacterized transport system substrate-binding protein